MQVHVIGIAVIAFVLSAQPVAAQDVAAPAAQSQAAGGMSVKRTDGKIEASGKVVARGAITNVNAERREITVKPVNGKEIVIPAGPEVKNFDQIKVGDQIVVKESESIILSLKKTEGEKKMRQREVSENVTTAKPGEKPSISATRETYIVADVVAVNQKKGLISLKGSVETRQFHLVDPSLLAGIKKGDQVEVVLTEGGTISIEPADGK